MWWLDLGIVDPCCAGPLANSTHSFPVGDLFLGHPVHLLVLQMGKARPETPVIMSLLPTTSCDLSANGRRKCFAVSLLQRIP